ncbi:MAG: RNA polymerase-associated protein rapA, partial [Gammaproteobacteria bacterium]|nr:RNA polymerase-associated protein rapA [Gammaproteobacteria bacterium]
EEADFFKYVLGVDVTVMTNLLISTQLIQFLNLDYVDDKTDANGNPCTGPSDNCGIYTGDFSSMSVDNSLNKGDEVETFISFFLSKPFGSDVQHRWNNITIAENGGGYWNRFDVEYSFNDEMLGTLEWNKYWGDEDTTFGQFEDSSNLQLGFKFIF